MMLIEESAVPQSALPLDEFKDHLRLGTGFANSGLQDAVLESFLRAAIAAIEARTGKILITRDFSWTLSCWRDQSGQALPAAPINAVTSVEMTDAGGTVSVLDAASYYLEQDQQRPRLRAKSGLLPLVALGGSVEIRFTAGIGASWGDLPADLGQAVLLLAAHYYEYRSETALGSGCMPFGVTSLIERYRTVRILGGKGGAV